MTQMQRCFIDFLNTPELFISELDAPFRTFELPNDPHTFEGVIPENLMLGKRMERFFEFHINKLDAFQLIAKNIQINKDKLTLGEIDFILENDNALEHVELVCKFYVYDPEIKGSHLSKWIGPNRKDSLVEKLNKLKQKQLPLLFKEETQEYLKALNLPYFTKQSVCYKAQLFLPYNTVIDLDKSMNNKCITGYYIQLKQLDDIHTKDTKYYIPTKSNWVTQPHPNVDWLRKSDFKKNVLKQHQDQKSPLCWVKHPKGSLEKIFVVNW